jgi:HK97 family phage major capsid protein
MTLATITASIFTAAGLATISNQLLADSNPAVDGLVTSDLTKRLVALEETAFLTGSGTGQPLGILNTPGLGTTRLHRAATRPTAACSTRSSTPSSTCRPTGVSRPRS